MPVEIFTKTDKEIILIVIKRETVSEYNLIWYRDVPTQTSYNLANQFLNPTGCSVPNPVSNNEYISFY